MIYIYLPLIICEEIWQSLKHVTKGVYFPWPNKDSANFRGKFYLLKVRRHKKAEKIKRALQILPCPINPCKSRLNSWVIRTVCCRPVSSKENVSTKRVKNVHNYKYYVNTLQKKKQKKNNKKTEALTLTRAHKKKVSSLFSNNITI